MLIIFLFELKIAPPILVFKTKELKICKTLTFANKRAIKNRGAQNGLFYALKCCSVNATLTPPCLDFINHVNMHDFTHILIWFSYDIDYCFWLPNAGTLAPKYLLQNVLQKLFFIPQFSRHCNFSFFIFQLLNFTPLYFFIARATKWSPRANKWSRRVLVATHFARA